MSSEKGSKDQEVSALEGMIAVRDRRIEWQKSRLSEATRLIREVLDSGRSFPAIQESLWARAADEWLERHKETP